MRFSLVFDGELPASANKPKPKGKAAIRAEFDPQRDGFGRRVVEPILVLGRHRSDNVSSRYPHSRLDPSPAIPSVMPRTPTPPPIRYRDGQSRVWYVSEVARLKLVSA